MAHTCVQARSAPGREPRTPVELLLNPLSPGSEGSEQKRDNEIESYI
jgi:hypothetical protein